MAQLDDLLSEPKLTDDYVEESVACSFVTGSAGTGKTYAQKKAIEDDPKHAVLCATTGIAAINLNATTLNSLLGYFDTDSLRERLVRGTLARKLKDIGLKVRNIVIDEISMMDGRQLDLVFKGTLDANSYVGMADRPLGIILTGDFCQLPPIKAPFAFEADCWEHFERNTTKLTKAWRQDNQTFLEAINASRAGQGKKCAEILSSLGVRFTAQSNGKFPGTTIMAKNDAVDNFNYAALMDLKTEPYGLKRSTWMYPGQSDPSEWKNIPEVLKLKDGAYVMILANDNASGEFLYANGDCGTIQSKDLDGTVWIKLKRTEKLVGIKPIVRYKTMRGDDAEKLGLDAYKSGEDRVTHLFCDKECGWDPSGIRFGPWGSPSYNCSTGSWNIGAIRYYPLRLAYATTVHKSQGLTLDNCQIDIRDRFFGSPNMAYVALSRCRTAEGLTIVGEPGKLAERVVLEPKVRRWL